MLIIDMTIACALKWGVASVGVYFTWCGSPCMGKTFKVQDVHRWTTLTRGAIEKKAGLWLCNHFCKDVWNEQVLACIFLYKSVVIKLLRTMLI